MFGHHKQPDLSTDDAVPIWGWPRSERARRRLRARADAERIGELRWHWRSACTATALSQMIYTPSGPTRAVPTIGRIDLGPPVSFTVRMRPGQTIADFEAAAPSIAPTFDVAALQILPFVPHWVRVVLLPSAAVPMPNRWAEPSVAAMKFGA